MALSVNSVKRIQDNWIIYPVVRDIIGDIAGDIADSTYSSDYQYNESITNADRDIAGDIVSGLLGAQDKIKHWFSTAEPNIAAPFRLMNKTTTKKPAK
ncbi:MAG TPA: hypothetical protein PKN48_02515 [Bacteroidales bacterium]|nr:hypothetical protein [Bacteroidales bacterium]